MDAAKPFRTAVYVDGCNLFNGLRDSGWRHCYWLDLHALSLHLIDGQDAKLVRVVYFTARMRGAPEKSRRHAIYIDALLARGGVDVIEGVYQSEPTGCRQCGRSSMVPKEKQTDTGITTEIMVDCFQDRWDKAYVISADSDLVPPIRRIRVLCPEKHIAVAFPPKRVGDDLKRHAHSHSHLNEGVLVDCQLPGKIITPNQVKGRPDVALIRPEKWR